MYAARNDGFSLVERHSNSQNHEQFSLASPILPPLIPFCSHSTSYIAHLWVFQKLYLKKFLTAFSVHIANPCTMVEAYKPPEAPYNTNHALNNIQHAPLQKQNSLYHKHTLRITLRINIYRMHDVKTHIKKMKMNKTLPS